MSGSTTTKTTVAIEELLKEIYGDDLSNFMINYDSDRRTWIVEARLHSQGAPIMHEAPKLGEVREHLYDLSKGRA